MNTQLEEKIRLIYKDAKQFASTYTTPILLKSEDKATAKELWDEYAKQIDYANSFRQKRKDLNFILTLLCECKNGVSANTPSGRSILIQVNNYIENIKQLIKVYDDIENQSWWVLRYYDKDGGSQ